MYVSTKSEDPTSLNATVRSIKSDIDWDIATIEEELKILEKFDTDLAKPFHDGIEIIQRSVNRLNTSIESTSPCRTLNSTMNSVTIDSGMKPRKLFSATATLKDLKNGDDTAATDVFGKVTNLAAELRSIRKDN
jgi:hypothetical protein